MFKITLRTNFQNINHFFVLCCLGSFLITGCATTVSNKYLLKINSTPPDALVSVHETNQNTTDDFRKVAGTTPLDKNFEFGEKDRLWLEVEKRGYEPQMIVITTEKKEINVQLDKKKDKEGKNVKEYSLPIINRVLLVVPDFKVIRRGLSKEKISEEETDLAKKELINGIRDFFADKYEVLTTKSSLEDLLKPLWRDARTAMELIDPIRLKYLPDAPYLETKSSRKAAQKIGKQYGAEVVLFICGKQNLETTGMLLGKVGLHTAGTAVSYTQSYNSALARGDDYFVYTIYTPNFAEGTLLKAVLIDCSNGEVLWANKGIWGKIPFNSPDSVKKIITDLFAGLH